LTSELKDEVEEGTGALAKAEPLVGTVGTEELEADRLTLWVLVASRRMGVDAPLPAGSIE
jgi:hypothetical protein